MIYSLDKINEMAEGDVEFLHTMVAVFLEEIPADLGDLEQAILGKDYENIYKLAHKMKPNLDTFGLEDSRLRALEIEQLGKNNGDYAEITSKFPELKNQVQQALQELQNDFEL